MALDKPALQVLLGGSFQLKDMRNRDPHGGRHPIDLSGHKAPLLGELNYPFINSVKSAGLGDFYPQCLAVNTYFDSERYAS